MRLDHITDRSTSHLMIEATRPFVAKMVDPALMTFKEYEHLVNKKADFHPESAYNWSLKQMNSNTSPTPNDYPTLINQITIMGLRFQIRLNKEDKRLRNYCKTGPDGEYLRTPDKQLIHYTAEEKVALIPEAKRWEYSYAIFDPKGQRIGLAQDEWGAMLIAVAKEYRGYGFGPILGKIARTQEPGKSSGGFTTAGYNNLIKIHREMVRDYVISGMYSWLVKSKQITAERAKEIIADAQLNIKPKQLDDIDLSNKPEDWLFYAGESGDYIIYNKKLAKLFKLGDSFEQYCEDMIIGMVYASYFPGQKAATLFYFGGENEKVKKFLLRCALSYMAEDNMGIHIPLNDLSLAQQPGIEIAPGISNQTQIAKLTSDPVDYKAYGASERRWRKEFDRYDEFRLQMIELAYAKYQESANENS